MTKKEFIIYFLRSCLTIKDKFFVFFIFITKVILQLFDLVSIGVFVYVINDIISVQSLYHKYNLFFLFESKELFYFYSFILLGFIFLLKYILIILQSKIYINWLAKKTFQLQAESLIELSKFDYISHSKISFTDINDSIILNLRSFIDNYLAALIDIFVNISYLIIGFVIILIFSFKISILLILLIIFFNLPFLFYLKKSNLRNGIIFTDNQPRISSYLEDYFTNNYLLSIYSLLGYYNKIINSLFLQSVNADRARKFYNDISKPIIEFSVLAVLILTVCYILLYSPVYIEELSSMVVVIVLLVRMLPFLQKLSQNYGQLNYYHKICVKSFLDLNLFSSTKGFPKYNDYDGLISADNILKLETSNLKIIIDEKTIKYPDIEVFKGDKILIHGNSGVGKSIMIKSILGIIPITESNIIINDNTYSKWLINGVGYVDQRIVMFSESVLFNITFSNQLSDVDLKKLKDILVLCHLTEKFPDIELLNYKFNSKQFSGGELQRISIARALYFQKGILVFDEATSGLSLQVSKSIISEIINSHSEITFFCITHQEELFSFFEKKIQL